MSLFLASVDSGIADDKKGALLKTFDIMASTGKPQI
jgi:hypothetical protein